MLSNMAVCHINLNDFEKALETYHDARTYCDGHEMPLLVVQADYNIAYLYYLRGEYTRALELYRAAREQCDLLGDGYHSALCDLDCVGDLSGAEPERRSRRARGAGADALRRARHDLRGSEGGDLSRPRHEPAGRPRATPRQLFNRARQLFARERNQVWLGLLDFYEALVLYRAGAHAPRPTLCRKALERFRARLDTGQGGACAICCWRAWSFRPATCRRRNERATRRSRGLRQRRHRI